MRQSKALAHHFLGVYPASVHELLPGPHKRGREHHYLAKQRERHGELCLLVPPPLGPDVGDDARPPSVVVARLDEIEQLQLAPRRRRLRRSRPYIGACHDLPQRGAAAADDEFGVDYLVAIGAREARNDGGLEARAAEARSGEEDLDLIPHGVAAGAWPAAGARAGILPLLLRR